MVFIANNVFCEDVCFTDYNLHINKNGSQTQIIIVDEVILSTFSNWLIKNLKVIFGTFFSGRNSKLIAF